MKRRDRIIKSVHDALQKVSDDVAQCLAHDDGSGERHARIMLARAIDAAVVDLEHACSVSPCNHGACLGTTLEDGSWAHDDDRERARPVKPGWCKVPNCRWIHLHHHH